MKKGLIVCLGVLILNLWLPLHMKAIIMTPIDTVYYFIKVDTSTVHVGYLRVDSLYTNLTVLDDVKGDYALWRFKENVPGTGIRDYHIINKKTGDTLAFNVPVTDDIALIYSGGPLKVWYDLFAVDNNDPELFLTSNMGLDYYLTYDGEVKISHDASTLPRLQFRIERPKFAPVKGAFYRIKVDTLPGDYFGYLSADTLTSTRDSLRIDTAKTDLTLWRFDQDTIINDTVVYYKITNKVTGDLMAFDMPYNDTVACVKNNGLLYQWMTPFFAEDKRTAQLIVCDTATKTNYYLGVDADTVVWLISDTSTIRRMTFFLEDELPPPPPIQYMFDSTQVYRIKYKNGPNVGPNMKDKYIGRDSDGSSEYLDSVYAHIPDGQFVVSRLNPNSLINRTQTTPLETMSYVIEAPDDTIPDTYVWRGDTIEVKAIDYGALNKKDPRLGYKYVHPSTLSAYCHYFTYVSPDSLEGRILGSDKFVKLLEPGDTATYLLEEGALEIGAPEVGDIAMLRRYKYRLRSLLDTTQYLSRKSPSEMTNDIYDTVLYYLKESVNPGEYYLLLYNRPPNPYQKLIVDSVSKQLIHAPKDTTAFSLFRIEQTIRRAYVEPDPYNYLNHLPDNKGRGFYELTIMPPEPPIQKTWLSKNFYDYPVLAREGESMLRAGSYTPYDLQLWVDTARGTDFQPEKPYFYIVKDVDTTTYDSYRIQGYFLHVIDSSLLAPNKDYTVEVDGKTYNRLNFVKARRVTANELRLDDMARDINGAALHEYRFYFQETDEQDGYYLVTEAGYGDGGQTSARGYLSYISIDTLYVGPREGALKIQFTGSMVANAVIPPVVPPKEEVSREIAVTGQTGQITILNAADQPVHVYNMLGRLIFQSTLATDHETIPTARGIHIVKVGPITRKVVVP